MYPNNQQYKVAIANRYYAINRNPSLTFEPVINDNSEPKFERGNKAVVFNVIDSDNVQKAIKLFFIEDNNQKEKFQKLSNHLSSFNNQSIIDFTFVNDLIYCDVNPNENDNYFPGLIMDWVEGLTLGTVVKTLTQNNKTKSLKKLAEEFKKLSLFIIDSDFGHGDLKHDNIIVDSNLNMKLIDYDGVYIPDFKGQKSSELGTPSFQHPKRTKTDFNAKIDDFSILSIYSSLLALAKHSYLYAKYEDQQNLLFRLEDFENPEQSEIFQFFDNDLELAKWSYLLKKSLANDHIYIPELKNYLNGIFPKPSIKVTHFPQKIITGGEVELSWTTENVEEVLFTNKNSKLNGSEKLTINSNSIFLFKLKNHFETIEYEYSLVVLPKFKIKEFRSKQQKIEFEKETQLVWDIENAEKVELHYAGNMEVVAKKGEKAIWPSGHTNYKLIITALDGITKEEKEITVQVFKRVEIKRFEPENALIFENHYAAFYWNVQNASKLILKSNRGFEKDVSNRNNYQIKVKDDAIFYLEASNDLFSKQRNVEINVEKAPRIPPLPELPQGKDLLPSFELDFKGLSENILNKSQISFQTAMKPTRKFSLISSLQKILKS